MIYLDTSALVKKYFQEAGTDMVREILQGGGSYGISKIAYAEVCAAFGRKTRENPGQKRGHLRVFQSFQEDWRLLTIVEVNDDLLPLIRALTARHPLRGADAIHLASALWLRRALRDEITFVASDGHLLNAARKETLKIINPEAA
jgi:predicted nucleic acid-binding protein